MHLCNVILYIAMLLFAVEIATEPECCEGIKKETEANRERIRKVEKRCSCPTGYIYFKNSCYRLVLGASRKSTWLDSQSFCENEGGNLITINHKNRERYIRNYLRNNFGSYNGELKLHTGLIYTDSTARVPFDFHYSDQNVGNSLRWKATREWVNTSLISHNGDPKAKWSPKSIQGNFHGPRGTYLSCVILIWNPDNKKSPLVWRFNDCSVEKINFICEVRLRPFRAKRKRKRGKRSLINTPGEYSVHREQKISETGAESDDDIDFIDNDDDDFVDEYPEKTYLEDFEEENEDDENDEDEEEEEDVYEDE